MYDNFTAKAFELVWSRGLGFAAAWIFGAYKIYKAENLFGLEVNDSERGLLIVLLMILCVTAHYFLKFCVARYDYYKPASYRDEVFSDVVEARQLAHFLMVNSRDPSIIDGVVAGSQYKLAVQSGIAMGLKIPDDKSDDAMNSFTEILKLSKTASLSQSLSEREQIQKTLQSKVSEFRRLTSWALKK